MTSMWPVLMNFQGGHFANLFSHIVDYGKFDELRKFVLVNWSFWNGQNRLVFKGVQESSGDMVAHTDRVGEKYHLLPQDPVNSNQHPAPSTFWKPPPSRVLKVNVDAEASESMNHFGVCLVGRDSLGRVIFTEGRCFKGFFSPHVAEFIAVKAGVEKAIKSGWPNWILKTAALSVIHTSQKTLFLDDDSIAETIRRSCHSAPQATLHHCPRNANFAVHDLARRCLNMGCNLVFLDAISKILQHPVTNDLLNSQ
ncbi:uncharacterized protein LOC142554704 [Primulina tabacum]|uniref:uncharacterized protein LOC142554704 n=1 Tax=Primulina tabacum TaxID=48773 RepID=UPI003F59D36B